MAIVSGTLIDLPNSYQLLAVSYELKWSHMRFTRTSAGRLELTLLDGPDHGVAQDVARAIVKAFGGLPGQPLHDIDGSTWLDIAIGEGTVTIHVARHYTGTSIYAASAESDGLIIDIANYLPAHAAELGLELPITGNARS